VEPSLARLLTAGNPRFWSLVDTAMLRQEGDLEAASRQLLDRWERVGEYPTELTLPVLLDLDPGAAREANRESDASSAPLWLLRPRPGVPSP
jgi:hypothetical protein